MSLPVVDGVTVAVLPPDGYIVDFAHPQRQANVETYWVAGFGNFLALLFLSQRFYTKLWLSGGVGLDDFCLLLSWIFSVTTQFLVIYMFATGSGGIHLWEESYEHFQIFAKAVYASSPIYVLCGGFAKASLLIFYLRLSPQRWYKVSVWATMGLVGCYSIGLFFSLVFACTPIASNWELTIAGKCVNRPSLYIATAVTNILSDIIIFCLPIPMIVKLRITRRQKYGLFFIFGIGSLTVVTSIIRVAILPGMLYSIDQSWVISWASFMVVVEANLFIICGALPTLRKFFKHVAPRIIGESSYGSKPSRSTGPISGKPTGPVHLVTIGSAKSKPIDGKYRKFDSSRNTDLAHDQSSEEFSMDDLPRRSKSSAHARLGDLESAMWETRVTGDDGSEKAIIRPEEKAIVQTRTIVVEYDQVGKAV